jgi:hypothetical protein
MTVLTVGREREIMKERRDLKCESEAAREERGEGSQCAGAARRTKDLFVIDRNRL